jgi:hypothetical protein
MRGGQIAEQPGLHFRVWRVDRSVGDEGGEVHEAGQVRASVGQYAVQVGEYLLDPSLRIINSDDRTRLVESDLAGNEEQFARSGCW